MVKTYDLDQIFAEWFKKSLLPSITEDVAKGGVVIEEQVTTHAQYLDLIYTQFDTLYDKIPNAPRPTFIVPPPPQSSKESHADDGVICCSSTQLVGRPSGQTLAITNQTTNALENTLASEVNVMSSDKGKNQKQPGGKKRGKTRRNKIILLKRYHLIPLLRQGNLVIHV